MSLLPPVPWYEERISEDVYYKKIKLYRGISELEYTGKLLSDEEWEKQLTPQKKATITKYENKLKKTKSKKIRQEIRDKISNSLPKEPILIALPQTITYSCYVLFINGKLFINPKKKELSSFDEVTYSKFGRHFDETNLEIIHSYTQYYEREATCEEVRLGEHKLNVDEYNKLIDIENQHNKAVQSKVVSKIANEYLNSIQVIKEEFRNWFELNGYPIPGDSGTAEVKNVQIKEPETKTENKIDNKTKNKQKPKKEGKDVEKIFWLESRAKLILFLQELQIARFIHKEDDIEKLAGDHFQVINENDSKTTDSQVKKIRWTQVPYELNYLIELCMNADYQLIRKEYKHHLMKCKHFADIEGNDFDSDVFNRAKSNKNAGRKGEGRGKVTYAPSLLSGEFMTILNKVKSKN